MKRKSSFGKIIFIILVLVCASLAGFVYFSPMFEKNQPKIVFEDNQYWNMRDKLDLALSDDSGIKYYRVIFKDGEKEIDLESKILSIPEKNITIQLKAPEVDMFFKSKSAEIIVDVIDSSKWNFLEGNRTTNKYKIFIDRDKPIADVISNSYAINRGGSALAIVKVEDENLKDAYVDFNGKRFELIPFYKSGYYASLIAWPVLIEDFKVVNLIAIDKASNRSVVKIPLYIRSLKERTSNINISESFINDVSKKVLNQSGKDIPHEHKDIFLEQNDKLRAENIERIEDVSRKYMSKELITNFDLSPFKRLKNGATAGYYGQKRSYYLNGAKIDEAWHLGVDWASVKHAPIYVTNSGKVIFNEYLGIYGNTIIIDHTLGLQTLYAHTSSSNVTIGQDVNKNDRIGNTGVSGAVLGDHLHFGVLVQGVEVDPLEWMDKNWIKTRIYDVISDAKKAIDNK